MSNPEPVPARLSVRRKADGGLVVEIAGDWRTDGVLPGLETVRNEITKPDSKGKRLEFDTTGMTGWGSRFVTLAAKCHEFCEKGGVTFVTETLPEGVRRLMKMSEKVPERKGRGARNGETVALARTRRKGDAGVVGRS